MAYPIIPRFALPLLLSCICLPALAQLHISPEGRRIVDAKGKPFFWLGDTAWELFHRLGREEAADYLSNRAEKGFTIIQAVVLAELDGLNTPNAYGALPLTGNDPTRPNEAYFRHVDYIVDKAEELGLYIGMLPSWGDKFNRKWGVGPEVFTPENARAFGQFIGRRYRGKPIIWILGGDRIPEEAEDFDIIRAMALGIRDAVGTEQLITYHPMGGQASADFFHEEGWLDLNLFQSGHGEQGNPNYRRVEQDYARTPVKPVIDGEPCYEDHPINWNTANGWFDDFDSRRAGYWAMLSGACGHTYGNHNIWQFWQPGRSPVSQARTPWQQAMDYPGAFQAGYMRRLFESRSWQKLVPASDMVKNAPNTGGRELRAALASDSSFAFVYTPWGSPFTLDCTRLKGASLKLLWFNPRMGHYISIGQIPKPTQLELDPPHGEQRGNDWVLVVEAGEGTR